LGGGIVHNLVFAGADIRVRIPEPREDHGRRIKHELTDGRSRRLDRRASRL
jgi:hypothetical protein